MCGDNYIIKDVNNLSGLDKLRIRAAGHERRGQMDAANALYDIADQIAREHAEDCFKMGYRAVADADAIAWVSDHGGLDAVRDKWDGRVDVDAVSRMVEAHKAKRERLKAHALGLERKCAERGETIRELSGKAAKQSDEIRVMRDVIAETCARFGVEGTGSTVDDAQVIWREISRRLMPEGMEWLVEAWPRFDDDSPVHFGDTALIDGEADMVEAVQLWIHGRPVIYGDGGSQQFDKGERVKRPIADTWERLEDDATMPPATYCERMGVVDDGGYSPEELMARDLVRRCKALAGVGE